MAFFTFPYSALPATTPHFRPIAGGETSTFRLSGGSRRNRGARTMRRLLRFCTPHGLVEMRRATLSKRRGSAGDGRREHFHDKRHEVIAEALQPQRSARPVAPQFEFEAGIRFLVSRGLDEMQIREGSIPEHSLDFIAATIAALEWQDRAIVGLHIGNFVGLSLAAFITMLNAIHAESLVIAIDPNVPHRGIISPQDHVLALLSHFQLQCDAIVVAGYSGRKSVSNDGTIFEGYDPAQHFSREAACENVIANFSATFGRCVDIAVIDGNHEALYLQREIAEIGLVLRPGGVLVLDDVDRSWAELRRVYLSLPAATWQDLGSDGRVGLLGLLPPTRMQGSAHSLARWLA
jgi:Methyltransferase domain